MKAYNQLQAMLVKVASALGDELLDEVAFLGGCTTGLLITDKVSREAVRYTDDDINCRMRLDELIVDFMPDDEKILGYSNRWYSKALQTAEKYNLQDGLNIKLVTPIFFIATKLEAYKGRGNDDPIQSRDIEDILNVIDGRSELVNEIRQAPKELQSYISEEFCQLQKQPEFEYAIQSTAQGQSDREELIFKRLESIT